jgi:hypothetical protein
MRGGYFGAEAAQYQTHVFGRVTDRTIKQINSLATSIDGEEVPEAIAMFEAIKMANPSYAYELAVGRNSRLPEKVAAIALDTEARGPAAIRSGAAIPEETFDAAAALYATPPEEAEAATANLEATGFLFWGQPGQTVSDAGQQRAFRSIAIAYMARAIDRGSVQDAALYESATEYAKKQIRELYQPMKIAGDTYAVRNDVAGVLRSTERTYDNVQTIAAKHKRELRSVIAGGDFSYAFNEARPDGDDLLVPIYNAGEAVSESHWLRIPMSPLELQEQVDAGKRRLTARQRESIFMNRGP